MFWDKGPNSLFYSWDSCRIVMDLCDVPGVSEYDKVRDLYLAHLCFSSE